MAKTRAGVLLDEAWSHANTYRVAGLDESLWQAITCAHSALEFARIDGNPRIEEWAEIALERFIATWVERAAAALVLL